MPDRANVNAPTSDAVDDAMIPEQDLADGAFPDLRNDPAGLWELLEAYDARKYLVDPDARAFGIVEMLAARWGVEPEPGGKSVWFELDA